MTITSSANTAPTFTASDGKVTANFGSTRETGNVIAIQSDGKVVVGIYSYDPITGEQNSILARFNIEGVLDSSFGISGIVKIKDFDVNSIEISSDNEIFVSGYPKNGGALFLKYSSSGISDINFGEKGKYLYDTGIGGNSFFITNGDSLSVSKDGSLFLGGYFYRNGKTDISLIKLSKYGVLDKSFDVDGVASAAFSVDSSGIDTFIQDDGKVLVIGNAKNSFGIARFNTDGSLDKTFGDKGLVTTTIGQGWSSPSGIHVLEDGKFLVAGTATNLPSGYGGSEFFAIAKYNIDGSLDSSFGLNGVVSTSVSTYGSSLRNLVIQKDGKIIVSGSADNFANSGVHVTEFAIARFNSDGTLDSSFGKDGKVFTYLGGIGSTISSTELQSDGKLMAVGYQLPVLNSYSFYLVRYNVDGSLDLSYSPPENTLKEKPTFKEQSESVILDRFVQIYDFELSALNNFNGSSLLISRKNQANAEDIFLAATGGTLSKLVSGSYFSVEGVTIGRVIANSEGILNLSFNQNASQVLVNKVLQQIAYFNSSDNPPSNIQLSWIFNDGNIGLQGLNGSLSVLGTTNISITAVNDAPYQNQQIESQFLYAGQAFEFTVPSSIFVDPDDQTLLLSVGMSNLTGIPPWLTFNASNKTFTGKPSLNDVGNLGLIVYAKDSFNAQAQAQFNLTILPPDTVKPTVTLNSNLYKLNSNQTALITFTLSEQSKSFTASDVVVTGGIISNFLGGGSTYTANFTPTLNSNSYGVINVPSGVFTDASGNFNEDGSDSNNTVTLVVDTIIPTIALNTSMSSLIAGDISNLTFTLSKASTSFVASDVAVTGGTLSNFSGSGTIYSALFTPTANSTTNGTVRVASGVFTDIAGNANIDGLDANNAVSFSIDTLIPTIAVSSNKSSLQGEDSATLTFTLSEVSTNFVESDITVTGGTLSNFAGVGTTYTAIFTLVPNSTVSATLSVANGVFTDIAGNKNADGSDSNNSLNFLRIPLISNESHTLSVIVDKSVLGADAILLKGLKESITYTNGAITKHIIEYSGSIFNYDQINSLITTVTRDGDFTSEFTKEINDYVGAELNITYSAAVKLVGFAVIDSVILSIAGNDGNFVG